MAHAHLVNQLESLNENLSKLTEAVSNQSFLDSQLFAAILGASSALLVLLCQQGFDWRKKRHQKLERVYTWMAEQIDFFDPKGLLKEAISTTYKSILTDSKTGEILEEIPEKPIGEKMVIELRTTVKYWKFPSFRLRRLFKKYEKSLLEFNNASGVNQTDLEKFFKKSNSIFEKLKKISFDKTGENEWTC